MKESLKKNYIYNLSYQILVILLPIITTPYLSRTLGAEGIGVYSYTISIVTYFILFGSVGLSMYGQREIAYVHKSKEKRSEVFIELVLLKFITMFIAGSLFYFFFAREGQYMYYFQILILELFANCFDISWFYQGLEIFKKLVLRNFFIKMITVSSIFIFIKGPQDIDKYLYIYVLSTLLGNITLWISVKKNVIKPKKLNLKRHFLPVLSLFIPQIAIQIYTVLDKTMIGYLLKDMSEVGYYEQSQKIIKLLLTIITALGTVMLPRIAKCFMEKKNKEIISYMVKTFQMVSFISIPLTFGVIVTSTNFVPIFFGAGFEKVTGIMSLMSLIIISISISNIIGTQYLLPTKRQKEFTVSVVIGACINFILNLIFIPKMKSIGATIATVFAELAVAIIQVYFVRSEFPWKEILKNTKNYFFAGCVMFIICYIIGCITTAYICIILQVFVGVIAYFLILLILKDPIYNELGQFMEKFKKIDKI